MQKKQRELFVIKWDDQKLKFDTHTHFALHKYSFLVSHSAFINQFNLFNGVWWVGTLHTKFGSIFNDNSGCNKFGAIIDGTNNRSLSHIQRLASGHCLLTAAKKGFPIGPSILHLRLPDLTIDESYINRQTNGSPRSPRESFMVTQHTALIDLKGLKSTLSLPNRNKTAQFTQLFYTSQ